jgi:hypothetical protein
MALTSGCGRPGQLSHARWRNHHVLVSLTPLSVGLNGDLMRLRAHMMRLGVCGRSTRDAVLLLDIQVRAPMRASSGPLRMLGSMR